MKLQDWCSFIFRFISYSYLYRLVMGKRAIIDSSLTLIGEFYFKKIRFFPSLVEVDKVLNSLWLAMPMLIANNLYTKKIRINNVIFLPLNGKQIDICEGRHNGVNN